MIVGNADKYVSCCRLDGWDDHGRVQGVKCVCLSTETSVSLSVMHLKRKSRPNQEGCEPEPRQCSGCDLINLSGHSSPVQVLVINPQQTLPSPAFIWFHCFALLRLPSDKKKTRKEEEEEKHLFTHCLRPLQFGGPFQRNCCRPPHWGKNAMQLQLAYL